MELEQILTDNEKNELDRFVNNEVQLRAVKKVVLSAVYFDGTIRKEGIPEPLTNFVLAIAAGGLGQLTRKQLGEKVEASLAGVQLLEKGFAKLDRFNKRKKPEVKRSNQAR